MLNCPRQWIYSQDRQLNNSDSKELFGIVMLIVLFVVLAFHNLAPQILSAIVRHRYMTASVISFVVMLFFAKFRTEFAERSKAKEIKTRLNRVTAKDSIFLGTSVDQNPVYIPLTARRMHTQIVGTTNAGKTESVILPWAIDDIKNGRGLILIDGKSDKGLLDKLYAYAVKYKRSKDFRMLSLVNPETSSSINPLKGGSADEVTERIFAAFSFEDEYYKNLQYEVLKQTLYLFERAGVIPTFNKLIQAITNPSVLMSLANSTDDSGLTAWADRFVALSKEDREKRTSGLVNQLGHFTSGDTAILFNSDMPQIDIEHVMREGLIVYFQLPVLKTPTLGKATAKLILQCIQSSVSSRHLDEDKSFPFFGVYLDDFTEYLIPSFVSLLNKSRSANVGITFAHQAQGDLGALGEEVKNTIQTNSNLKVFMRTNEPETAEYFSRLIGTKEGTKMTERAKKGLFGSERTGDGSVRDVEEFIYHPNTFKKELGTGDGVIVVPFNDGAFTERLKFQMQPDLKAQKLPRIAKAKVEFIELKGSQNRSSILEAS